MEARSSNSEAGSSRSAGQALDARQIQGIFPACFRSLFGRDSHAGAPGQGGEARPEVARGSFLVCPWPEASPVSGIFFARVPRPDRACQGATYAARNGSPGRSSLRFRRKPRGAREGNVHRARRAAEPHLAAAAGPRAIPPARRALRPDRFGRARPGESYHRRIGARALPAERGVAGGAQGSARPADHRYERAQSGARQRRGPRRAAHQRQRRTAHHRGGRRACRRGRGACCKAWCRRWPSGAFRASCRRARSGGNS